MWHFLVLVVILGATSGYAVHREQRISNTVPQEDALAINMSVYLSAVVDYLNSDPDFKGTTVASQDMSFPPAYVRHPAWDNIVDPLKRQVFVYAKATLPFSITDAVGRAALYSQNAGEARNGRLYVPAIYDSKANSNPVGTVLPPAIPDGAPVRVRTY
jgi:hypothetical protein